MAETALLYLETTEKEQKTEFATACKRLTQWRGDQVYPSIGFAQFNIELERREDFLRELLNIDKKAFTAAREQVISKQSPKERCKELFYLFDGQFYPITVSHKPMALVMFGEGVTGDRSALAIDGTFYPSCMRDAGRAVNMNVTQVTLGDEDVMKEIRTGVPFAHSISNKELQKAVTRQRFIDILTVAGLTFCPELMKAGFRPKAMLEADVFKLGMFYICLLSPDNLRPTFSSIPGVDNERRWCHKLDKRIAELNVEQVELPVCRVDGCKGSVRVQPEIFMFVCPCNQLAYASSLQFTQTWENADVYNRETFLRLFGTTDYKHPMTEDCYVQTFLDEHLDLDPVVKKELLELCYLLRYMFSNKLHRVLSDLPFTFATCISELGRAMKVAIVSGCKSAKDRTGNYERSNIEMALRFHLTRKALASRLFNEFKDEYFAAVEYSVEQLLPPIDRTMSAEDFYNHAMLLLCSDQIEITLDNLGKPGFKIPDYMLGFIKALFPSIDAYLTPVKSETRKASLQGDETSKKTSSFVKAKGSFLGVTTGFSLAQTPPDSSPQQVGTSTFYCPL